MTKQNLVEKLEDAYNRLDKLESDIEINMKEMKRQVRSIMSILEDIPEDSDKIED